MINTTKIPDSLLDRVNEISDKINDFNNKVLNESYSYKCDQLLEQLVIKEETKVSRGKTNTWAAGVTHAIFFVNDTLNQKGIHMDELADFFEVSEGTIGTKSREIRKALNITKSSTEWKVNDDITEDSKEVYPNSDDSEAVIQKFSLALGLENIEEGAKLIRECSEELESRVKSASNGTLEENVFSCAEGDFYLTVLATLSNYEFAMGHYEESFKIEKNLIELDKDDIRNVKHSIIFRALMVKDYDYVKEIFDRYKDDDSLFFKYGKVLYYFYKGDRKNARKYLKKAVKHNFKFVECLVGNRKVSDGEITSYTKGSIEEASLCLDYSLPLWTNEKIGAWLVKAINKVR